MPDEDATATAVDAQVNDADKSANEPSQSSEATEVEQPKPGTPDKALQKMQQELGNVTRELAALKEQKQTGELTAAQQAKLAKTEKLVAQIRNFANRPDRNEIPSEVDPVAEQVLDLTERVSRQDQIEAENRDMKARLARLENDRNWEIVRTKYADLDTDAIWGKANTDADDILGEAATPDAKNRLASRLFEDRCNAAMKRKGEVAEPAKPKNGQAPSTYKVGTAQRVAPVLSEDEEVMAEARSLVREI